MDAEEGQFFLQITSRSKFEFVSKFVTYIEKPFQYFKLKFTFKNPLSKFTFRIQDLKPTFVIQLLD